MYIAYVLPEAFREALLDMYPPSFPECVGHHITYKFGVNQHVNLPDDAKIIIPSILITDHVRHVECMTVAINGYHERADGKMFHITWSLDRSKGAKPVHSNDAIDAYMRGETGGMTVKEILWEVPMYLGEEGVEMEQGISGPPIKAELLR